MNDQETAPTTPRVIGADEVRTGMRVHVMWLHEDGAWRAIAFRVDGENLEQVMGHAEEGRVSLLSDAPTEDGASGGQYVEAPASVMSDVWQRTYEQTARERDALAAKLERVRELCKNTDGDWLDPEAELPVGVFQEALLDGDA